MIFIDNKYTRWYYNIINRAKSRSITGYTEKHHIIPKSCGGSNDKVNLVKLTAKEHFICHLLLTKMVEGLYKTKMSFAVSLLSRSKKLPGKINSKTYEYIKRLHSEATSIVQKGVKEKYPVSKDTREKISKSLMGKKLSEEIKSKMRKPKSDEHRKNMLGRFITEETKKKLSDSALGRKASYETRKKQSISAMNRLPISFEAREKISKANKGKVFSDKHKRNLSIMQKNLPRVCCLHCGYDIDSRTFNRFHNNLCKKDSRV
jgi:hypothetical protein